MKRLIALDLDGTLAALGQPIPAPFLEKLSQWEQAGHTIALCSGKPVYYLCGLLRQCALRRPAMIGEDGAVWQLGVDLPPKHYGQLPLSPAAQAGLEYLKKELGLALPHLWYQTNQVCLTPFPATAADFTAIEALLAKEKPDTLDLRVYRHNDSFDICPANVNKGAGLLALARALKLSPQATVAVGDGENDLPMFSRAALSVGIGLKDPGAVTKNCPTPWDALCYVDARLREG